MSTNGDTMLHFSYILSALVVIIFIAVAIWSMIEWPKKLALERTLENKLSAARAALAQENGWLYEATPEHEIKFRLSGELSDSAAWQLWFDLKNVSTSVSPKLIFCVADKKSQLPQFYIGDAVNYDAMRVGVGHKMLGVATVLLDRLADGKLNKMMDFFNRATTKRRGNWIIASTTPVLLNAPNLSEVLAQLDLFPKNGAGNAPNSKSIQIWQNERGLQIEIEGEYADTNACEHLCKIGFLLSQDI
jgi:hypothetical protein